MRHKQLYISAGSLPEHRKVNGGHMTSGSKCKPKVVDRACRTSASFVQMIAFTDAVVGGSFLVPPGSWRITAVLFYRGTAGLAGTTEVDLMRGVSGTTATSLYTTTGNRPKITALLGNSIQISATLPDIVDVAGGDRLEMNVLTVETGLPAGTALQVVLTPR
jgi:hypothetical protein